MHDAQNEDLLSLIKYVNLSPNKLLILNSRITIFQEAKALKPDLVKSMEDGEYKTIILDVNALSDIEKAKIFYNHLFFNKTPIDNAFSIQQFERLLHHSDFERIIENSIESNNIEKFHFENEDRKIALIAYYIGKLQISNRNYIEYLKSYLSSPSPFYLKGQFYARKCSI